MNTKGCITCSCQCVYTPLKHTFLFFSLISHFPIFATVVFGDVLCPFPSSPNQALTNMVTSVLSSLDHLQFAYKSKMGTDDTTIIMFNTLAKHLQSPIHYAQVLFIDFTSAFNGTQIHILLQRLGDLEVSGGIIHWVRDFLSDCPQRVTVLCVRWDSAKHRSTRRDKFITITFFKSLVKSVLAFNMIMWYGNLTMESRSNLQRVVNMASKIIGRRKKGCLNRR